jgi:YbbR domain-containing protein
VNRPRARPSRLTEAALLTRDLRRRAWGAIRATPGLLLISLLLGGALWLSVTDAENPTRVDTFPAQISVEAVNAAPTLAVANALQTVEVRVSAPEDRWESLTSENFRAFVDLNGMGSREQLVNVQVDVVDISGVRIVGVSPSAILVNLEPFVSKDVEVRPRLLGSVPLGYRVASAEAEQETVRVSGPESLVNLVREVAAEVNVTGLTVGLEQSVSLVPRGEGAGEIRGVTLDPPSLRVAIEVEQTILQRLLPLRTSITGEPAAGYRITDIRVDPPAARVDGPIDALQSLDSIAVPEIDITGATADVTESLVVEPGAGTITPREIPVSVTVAIEPMRGSLTIPVTVSAVNVPEGLQATLDPMSVSVTLEGELPVLNSMLQGDVTATVDLAEAPRGTALYPVTIATPPGTTVLSVQPVEVSVTLDLP